jgi:nitrite reductase/ring-hydroxylating ferredoxin subunit
MLIAAVHRGKEIVVAKLPDGRVFTMPDHCPHDGGRLSDGFLEGDRLVCARHGWEFDLESGRCVGRPAIQIPSELLKTADS